MKRIHSGCAFSLDYREARGYASMLSDQLAAKRVTEHCELVACAYCHASVVPTRTGAASGPVAPSARKHERYYAEQHRAKHASLGKEPEGLCLERILPALLVHGVENQ